MPYIWDASSVATTQLVKFWIADVERALGSIAAEMRELGDPTGKLMPEYNRLNECNGIIH